MRSWKRYPKYKDSGVEWLGEIPDGWKGYKIKYLLGKSKSSIKTGPFGSQLLSSEYCDTGYKIYNQQNVILKNPAIGDDYIDEEKYRSLKDFKVYPRDLLITTRGTIGKCLTLPENCFEGILHPCLIRLQIDHLIADQHLLEIFIQESDIIIHELKINSNATTIDVIYSETLKNVHLFLPPLPEQTAIASFLDRETTRIDALIEKKQRQIELLQEKRAALISQAVTKGLDPTVPMKDSGVPWLGEVPEHWEILQLRRVIKKFVDYRGKTPEKVESGITLITAKNVKDGIINLSLSKEYIREEEYESWMVRGLPEIGDVLITTEAPLGEVAQITDTQIALAQRIILLKSELSKILNEYLKFQLMSGFGKGELWSRATGSTAIGIKAEHLKSIQIILPPISEQKEIISYIIEKTKKLEQPLNIILNSITILQEYRSALISAAVTGKIDIRNEATA